MKKPFFDGRLKKLKGSKKQVEWAESIREKALFFLWEQGFHGTYEEFYEDCDRLPVDASWWIDNRKAANEAARMFWGYEYKTVAGADY